MMTRDTQTLSDLDALSGRSIVLFILKFLLFLFLLGVLYLWTDYYDSLANEHPLITRIINATVFYFSGHLVITATRLILIRVYLRKHKLRIHKSYNFIIGINQVSAVLSFFIFFIALLSLFDITLPQLFTALSIVAAALAILSKDYISNMINGLIIMFTDQVSVHDFVKIGQHKGRIVDVKLMNMHMVNEDDELVLIPNTALFNTEVINYSKQAIPKVIVEFQWAIQRGHQLEELKQFLQKNLYEYHEFIAENSIALKITHLGKDQIDLKFQLILKENNDDLEKTIKKKVPFLIAAFHHDHLTD